MPSKTRVSKKNSTWNRAKRLVKAAESKGLTVDVYVAGNYLNASVFTKDSTMIAVGAQYNEAMKAMEDYNGIS